MSTSELKIKSAKTKKRTKRKKKEKSRNRRNESFMFFSKNPLETQNKMQEDSRVFREVFWAKFDDDLR